MQLRQMLGVSLLSSVVLLGASMATAQGAPGGYSADGYAQAGVSWDGSEWGSYALGKGWLDVPFPGGDWVPGMGLELSFSGLSTGTGQASAIFPAFYFGVANTRVNLGLPQSAFERGGFRRDMAAPYGPVGLELDVFLRGSYATMAQYSDIYSPGVRVDGKIGDLDASASYLYDTTSGVRSIAVSARYGNMGGVSILSAAEVATDGVSSMNSYFLGVEKDGGPMRYGLQYGSSMFVGGEYASGYVEYTVSDRLTAGATGMMLIGSPDYMVGVDARYDLGDFSLNGSYLTGGVLANDTGVFMANFAIGMDF